MAVSRDIIIGIDAGTSVIKAVAFDLGGQQLASAAVRNTYDSGPDGAVTQSLEQTWRDCAAALRGLNEKVDHLPQRCAAVSVTGQGDGTWLIDGAGAAVCDAWLWLDARAAPTVERLARGAREGAVRGYGYRAQHLSAGGAARPYGPVPRCDP